MSDIGKLEIVLKVKDVAASVDFYKKLGFLPVNQSAWTSGYACFMYRDTHIALMDLIPQEVLLLNLEQKDQTSVNALGERLEGDGIRCIPAGPPDSRGLVRGPRRQHNLHLHERNVVIHLTCS
ncbi:MAG: hypothetical protein QGG98_06120 [Pseudomonadales bacterium]|jgi:catechol 2,3-dioxygenase-like lactoylglutathione lyase family enzyme|nr:hypothetical protein [Pseudomonadales bacterium]